MTPAPSSVTSRVCPRLLGQVASPYAASELTSRLRDPDESPMLRHECAEALGSLASPGLGVEDELLRYLSKETTAVVRESLSTLVQWLQIRQL